MSGYWQRLASASQARAAALARGIESWRQRLFTCAPATYLRRSLSLQVVVGMGLVIIAVLAMLFVTVTYQVRGNVFEQRRTQIIEDASVRINQAQTTFDQSTATTPDQVQDLANQLVSSLQSSSASAGAVSTMLLRSPHSAVSVAINDLIDRDMISVITPQLRQAVASGEGQYYQSVAIPSSDGEDIPGIVVGSLVTLPVAGEYELYTVYSLGEQQATVRMMLSTLALGAVPVVLVLALGLLLVTYRLLSPVRITAEAATKLADGDLNVRVQAHGENEMAQLAHAFNNMAQSLSDQINEYDELSKLEQRFVSDVSHELRTPLTTIRMAEEIIYDAHEKFDPVTSRTAELLHEQVDRMEKMLADLLEISRYDARSAALEAEDRDLRELVNKVVEEAVPLAQANSVPIKVIAPRERCTAQIDERRIERVLRNLVVNAIEHAEGGPVEVHIASNDTMTAVRVMDHGVGMSEETCKQVFERFFRADPARTRTTGGTGLGLSIAREDVALHAGRITAWGELGVGSSFLVELPRSVGQSLGESPLELWPERAVEDTQVSGEGAADEAGAADGNACAPAPTELPNRGKQEGEDDA